MRHCFSCCLLLVGVNTFCQTNPTRVALVIGIRNYENVAPLQNSLNDAQDMASLLAAKGFQVIQLYDAKTKRELLDGVKNYFALLQNRKDATGILYYSGHGMQVDGDNYLVPASANLQIRADVDDQCLNMSYIMQAIEQAGNGLNIFILDACRNNPFRGFTRSAENGLSMVNAPKGSYIVYATKPGTVASDGTGRNGLFTSSLLTHLNTPNLSIEQVFKRVAADVSAASGDTQRPWISSDYTGDFYFSSNETAQTAAYVPPQQLAIASAAPALDKGILVKIGKQQWYTTNLSATVFSNGEVIPEARSDDEWSQAGKEQRPAWCYMHASPLNGKKYGKLYNWYAVMDERGLCPAGSHIPTEHDMLVLSDSILAPEPGPKLMAASAWNSAGTNSSGFGALPGGIRDYTGQYKYFENNGLWWTSSEASNQTRAMALKIFGSGKTLTAEFAKGFGFSVRCLRDKP